MAFTPTVTLPGFHECPECDPACGDPKHRHVGGCHLYADPNVEPCRNCGGAGQVPDDDTVEAAAKEFYGNDDAYLDTWGSQPEEGVKDWYRKMARSALLAYARHTQEAKP